MRGPGQSAAPKGVHSRKKIDLVGQRYGRLTVLAPAENVDGRTAWLCRCECGREVVEKTVHLRAGRVKSCGCLGGEGIGKYLTYIDGTCVEMLQARTVRRNNTSGVPGVDWMAGRRRWRAGICFQGKRHYLGSYARFKDAVKARKEAEDALYGRFLAEHGRGKEGGQKA